MLTFVGLGLWDERSVTVEGRDAIRAADRVFAEFYTSRLMGTSVADLEAYHDTEIEVRGRAGVEQDPDPVLDAAADGDAVFLTAGDTMVSTTHVDLRLRAADRSIETRVVHGTTAEAAASALTGLQNYRFGKATTVPFPYRDDAGVPESVVDAIRSNRNRDLHTLLYLDIKVEETSTGSRNSPGSENTVERDDAADRFMSADVAAGLLANAWDDDVLAVAVCRAGSPDPLVAADRLSALREQSFGGPLHLLVVPATLHHVERDALETLANAPSDALAELTD